MPEIIPSIFYKYTTASTAAICLESGSFRWSSPLLFNDPFEQKLRPLVSNKRSVFTDYIQAVVKMAFNPDGNATHGITGQTKLLYDMIILLKQTGMGADEIAEEMGKAKIKDNKSEVGHVDEYFKQYPIEASRMFCVSESRNNLLMWAHYASNHSGCVISLTPKGNSALTAATKVVYVKQYPTFEFDVNTLIYGHTVDNRKKMLEKLFYTKSHDWSYEMEWRAITDRPNHLPNLYSDFEFDPQDVSEVILGCRITSDDRNKIINIVKTKYPWAKCFAAKTAGSDFSLNYTDVI